MSFKPDSAIERPDRNAEVVKPAESIENTARDNSAPGTKTNTNAARESTARKTAELEVEGKLPSLRLVESGSTKGETPSSTSDFDDSSPGDPAPEKQADGRPDAVVMESAADAIHHATDGGLTSLGTNEEEIFRALEDKSEAERAAMNTVFQEKHGMSLDQKFRDEMQGADLARAQALLTRKDGEGNQGGRIKTALAELDQTFVGRGRATIEKDIRQTLSTMRSDEIAGLDQQFADRGGLRAALQNDSNISAGTKVALNIYLKGADKRNDRDVQGLANIALKNQDLDMFQEAFVGSSPEARGMFAERGGDVKMQKAFGVQTDNSPQTGPVYAETTALKQAREYATAGGELSLATDIRNNTSLLGDNEQAIDAAVSRMSQQEREAYLRGRSLADPAKAQSDLMPQQTKDLSYYNDVRSALEGAGNATEVAQWETQIFAPGDRLGKDLAAHRGMLVDSSMNSILTTIEDMDETSWTLLKNDPQYRGQLEATLGTYLNDQEMTRARESLTKMSDAADYADAQQSGKRSVLQAIDDNSGILADKGNIVRAVENMSPADRRRYFQGDPDFKRALDQKVTENLSGARLRATQSLLGQVARNGEKPALGLVEQLEVQAEDFDKAYDMSPVTTAGNRDSHKVLGEVQDALDRDPALKEKIVSGTDPEMTERVDQALQKLLSHQDYETYGKPLLASGRLPLDKQMELNRNLINTREMDYYRDILRATPAEKQLLLDKDPNNAKASDFQGRVLGSLNVEERKVALNVLEQGEMRPEDNLRAAMLGGGTDSQAIETTLSQMKSEQEMLRSRLAKQGGTPDEIDAAIRDFSRQQRDQLVGDYSRKYGADLGYDLMRELSGNDEAAAVRAVQSQPQSAEEAFARNQDEYYRTRDGIGDALLDGTWDGTGLMADQDFNANVKAMREAAVSNETLSLSEQQRLTDNLHETLALTRESKSQLADTAAGVAVTGAAALAAPYTAGASLATLAACGSAGGAAVTVGTRALVVGSEYELIEDGLTDAGLGAIGGASEVIGGEHLLKAISAGKGAAGDAAAVTVRELGEQGARAAERNADNIARDGLAHLTDEMPVPDVPQLGSTRATARPEVDATAWGEGNRVVVGYSVDGHVYPLDLRGGFFYGKDGRFTEGPLKVHVNVSDGNDLARLQEVLIPALANPEDAHLQKVRSWKTMDPRYGGVGSGVPAGLSPGPTNQHAKGFTMYFENEADAIAAQKRLDEVIAQHADLCLEKPLETGNADKVYGQSNRVGVSRDRYSGYEAVDPVSGKRAAYARIEPELEMKICSEYGVDPGDRLTENLLRDVEWDLGLQRGMLRYDDSGNLVARLDNSMMHHGAVYATESGGAVKHVTPEQAREGLGKTDRPALHAIAEGFGHDPVSVATGKAHTVPSRVSVNREDFLVDSIDPISGDAILRQPRATRSARQEWVAEGLVLEPGELAKQYGPVQIGNQNFVRDGAGNVYEVLDLGASYQQLIPRHDYKLIPQSELPSDALGGYRHD